jgi:hypothetical protein
MLVGEQHLRRIIAEFMIPQKIDSSGWTRTSTPRFNTRGYMDFTNDGPMRVKDCDARLAICSPKT